jgi:hypothetical protein
MNLTQILDASALAVLAAQAGWIGLLYRRMGRLRASLESAGAVVGQLDAASRRLDDSAGGIVQKVRDGIAEVDSKIGSCRRLAQELTTASRHAEEVATRLDQALRQNRKLQSARAAAPPRELVEPLGLAERLSARPALGRAAAAPELKPGPVLDLDLRAEPATQPAESLVELALPSPVLQEGAAPLPLLNRLLTLDPALPEPFMAPPPLGDVLAAELLFAERPASLVGLAPLDAATRTIRVKLD